MHVIMYRALEAPSNRWDIMTSGYSGASDDIMEYDHSFLFSLPYLISYTTIFLSRVRENGRQAQPVPWPATHLRVPWRVINVA